MYIYIDASDRNVYLEINTEYKPITLVRYWRTSLYTCLGIAEVLGKLKPTRCKVKKLAGPLGDFADGVYDAVLILRDDPNLCMLLHNGNSYAPEAYLKENAERLEYLY